MASKGFEALVGGMVDSILLIAKEWEPRILIRAQLSEEGYEVIPLRTIEEAMALLCRGAVRFNLIVLDTHSQSLKEHILADLRELAGDVPILLCTGPYDMASFDFRKVGFEHLLVRPFAIREVIDKAGQVLGQGNGGKGGLRER